MQLLKWLPQFLLFFVLTPAFSQNNQYYWYKTIALIENDNIEMALLYIDSAIQQNPKNVEYCIKRAEILFQSGNLETAIAAFNSCNALKGDASSLGLAKVYASQQNFDAAIAELKKYLSGSDKISESQVKLDPSFVELSKMQEWTDLWKTEWYNAGERFVTDVEYLFSRKKWDQAVELLSNRLGKSKGNHRLFALRGHAFYNLSSYKSAEADFSESIRRSKRNPNYYFWRAKCRLALKQHKAASKDLDMAMELSGDNPKFLPERARVYAALGYYESAIESLKIYFNYYPADFENQFLFGTILFESNNYLEALFALGKVIRSGNANAECYELRGLIYVKSSSWELALTDFTKALELEPNRAQTMHYRAEVLIKQGMQRQACIELKEAINRGYFPSQELFFKHCKK